MQIKIKQHSFGFVEFVASFLSVSQPSILSQVLQVHRPVSLHPRPGRNLYWAFRSCSHFHTWVRPFNPWGRQDDRRPYPSWLPFEFLLPLSSSCPAVMEEITISRVFWMLSEVKATWSRVNCWFIYCLSWLSYIFRFFKTIMHLCLYISFELPLLFFDFSKSYFASASNLFTVSVRSLTFDSICHYGAYTFAWWSDKVGLGTCYFGGYSYFSGSSFLGSGCGSSFFAPNNLFIKLNIS